MEHETPEPEILPWRVSAETYNLQADYRRLQNINADLLAALDYYRDTFCEGFCNDVPPGFTSQKMEFDCSGCKARAAIAKARNTSAS